MNLKDLKYLVALADTGHFGRAAERTFVSQPTLSAQLKKLEEYLGVKLVERQPNNVQLTEVGKEVVVRARRMLGEGDEIIALARNNTDPFAGRLKMALIPTIGPYLLPRVMQKIRKALPHLSLLLYEHQTEPLLKRLRDGEIDLGIVALPTAPDGLDVRELYKEVFTVALPDGHPLTQKSTIKTQDLKGHTLLLLEDGHCLRDQALSVCRLVGTEAAEMQATGMPTLCQMVATGLGVTLLPESAVVLEARPGTGLTTRPFAPPVPARTIGLVWRRTSPADDLYRELSRLLSDTLAARTRH